MSRSHVLPDRREHVGILRGLTTPAVPPRARPRSWRALPSRYVTAVALVLAASFPSLACADEPPPHVDAGPLRRGHAHLRLDVDALYGIGAQSFLGGDAHLFVDTPVWRTRLATGTLGGGAAFVFHVEPTFMAPWIDRDAVTGRASRIQLLALGGHVIHIGKARRFSLGMHLFGGWNHWRSAYRVAYPAEDLSGEAVVVRNHAIVGGQLRVGARVAKRVGLNLQMGAPFPTQPSYGIGLFTVGLGISILLR